MKTVNLLAIRDGVVSRAVAQRKIAADRADDYKRMYSASPKAMFDLLTLPVAQGGLAAAQAAPATAATSGPDDYPAEWLGAHERRAGRVAADDPAALTAASPGAPAVAPAQPGGNITVEP